jgi:hypothetical protein
MKEARTRGCTAPRAGIEPATLPADRRLSGYSAPQQGGQARPPPHAKLFCVRRVRNTDAAGASCSFGFFGDFRPFLGELEPPNLAGFVLGRLCPSPTPLCRATAGRWMALGHCLCVSAREASSPAVLAKGKCLAYVAPAASTGAFLFASSGSRYRPMPRTGPRRCQRARSFCLCALLPQAADRVVAAGARGPGFAKSDTSSATIVLDEFNAGAFRNAWRSGREQMVHVDGQLASARVFSMSDRATTSSAPNCS